LEDATGHLGYERLNRVPELRKGTQKNTKKLHEALMSLHSASIIGTLICSGSQHKPGPLDHVDWTGFIVSNSRE